MNQSDKDTNPYEKIRLYVPDEDKDQAKALGAQWDTEEKTWYVYAGYPPAGNDPSPFKQWLTPPVEQAQDKAQAAEKQPEQDTNRRGKFDVTADKITAELQGLKPAPQDHPYLVNHGIEPSAKNNSFGALVDKDNNLVIPLQDIEGKVWSVQRITAEGFKSFEKDAAAGGMYHHIPGVANGESTPLIIAIGFGTGTAINAATGAEVICAMSSYNLKNIAREMRHLEHDRQIIVMGDDNVLARKATESAAEEIAGIAWFPRFKEKDTQSNDFADLAVKKGLKEVNRQYQQAVRAVQKNHSRPANPRKIKLPVATQTQVR